MKRKVERCMELLASLHLLRVCPIGTPLHLCPEGQQALIGKTQQGHLPSLPINLPSFGGHLENFTFSPRVASCLPTFHMTVRLILLVIVSLTTYSSMYSLKIEQLLFATLLKYFRLNDCMRFSQQLCAVCGIICTV